MDNEVVTAARYIVQLKAEIAEKQELLDQLKQLFKQDETFGKPGVYDLGEYEIIVTKNKRLSDDKARAELDGVVYGMVSSTKIDPKLARKNLTKSQLDKISTVYEPRLEVREKNFGTIV